MRFLAGVIVALLMAWAGYWVVGQRMIEARIAEGLTRLPPGWVVEQAGYDVAGFPSRFDLTVTAPRFADAATGWGWSAEFAQVFALTWQPWHLIAALPHRQDFDTPFGPAALDSTRFMASLRVGPSGDLPFEEAVLEIETPRLSFAPMRQVAADKVVVALKHEGADSFSYRLGVQVTGLSPVAANPAGGVLAAGRIDLRVTTTAALDRNMAQTPTGLREVDLSALSLDWGSVKVTGAGLVSGDTDGFAEGEIGLQLTGWREVPARLVDFGILRPEIAPTVLRALEVIAAEQGNPAVLDLPLRFKSGRSYLGPLPIGVAPWLDQRQ